MSEENGKDESASITTHTTTRERNLIPGIKDSHIAIGGSLIALAAVGYVIGKPILDNLMQNMALARQQAPPPPPAAQAVPPQPELPLAPAINEYVDEPEPNAELAEVDHKNYQTTRRKPRNVQQSQFGVGIQGG